MLAEDESFAALPSHAPLDTVAVLVAVPSFDAVIVTVTVTVADAPAASVPSWHVTFAVAPQVPWLGIADSNVAPTGSVCASTTFAALAGPVLVIVAVYVVVPPGATGPGVAVMLTARSAFVVTVKSAGFEVAVPQTFVKTARYRLPFCETAAVKDSVVLTAPGMSLKLEPPSVDTCHCTVGVGVPPAAAVKLAVADSQTDCGTDCVVTNDPCWTWSVDETLPGASAMAPVPMDVNPEMFAAEVVKLPTALAITEAVTVHDPPPAGSVPPPSVSVVEVPPAVPPRRLSAASSRRSSHRTEACRRMRSLKPLVRPRPC